MDDPNFVFPIEQKIETVSFKSLDLHHSVENFGDLRV